MSKRDDTGILAFLGLLSFLAMVGLIGIVVTLLLAGLWGIVLLISNKTKRKVSKASLRTHTEHETRITINEPQEDDLTAPDDQSEDSPEVKKMFPVSELPIDKEDKSDSLLLYDDWRQDLLDFSRTVDEVSLMKNRYSVLQNATYIANKFINEYTESGMKSDFYSFVMEKCSEMTFAQGEERLLLDLTGEIAELVKDGKSRYEIVDAIREKCEEEIISHRLRPEELYPIERTGDQEVEQFSDLAMILAHKRLHHLNISEKEFDRVLDRCRMGYSKRDWNDFFDFFTHSFQFGYLREKRFQRLYLILYLIAQGLSEGLTKDEIIRQIDSIYVIDEGSAQDRDISEGSTVVSEEDVDEHIPFYSYSREEHRIISVASRISRKFCNNPVFKKTVEFAIMIINKYHKVSPSMSERLFISFTVNSLKKERPRYSSAYDLVFRISESIFAGLGEDASYKQIVSVYMAPFLSDSSDIPKNSSNSKKKTVKDLARKELEKTINECRMKKYTNDCHALVSKYHTRCQIVISTKYDYFKYILTCLERERASSDRHVVSILKYILRCKLNDVPDVSFSALVRTKFHDAYYN